MSANIFKFLDLFSTRRTIKKIQILDNETLRYLIKDNFTCYLWNAASVSPNFVGSSGSGSIYSKYGFATLFTAYQCYLYAFSINRQIPGILDKLIRKKGTSHSTYLSFLTGIESLKSVGILVSYPRQFPQESNKKTRVGSDPDPRIHASD